MTFFTFTWTFLFITYLATSALFLSSIYNYYVQLALEGLATLWWLVTWALLASEASSWNVYDWDFGFNYLPKGWKTAIICTKAAAGLGALEWILFCYTLVAFGMHLGISLPSRFSPHIEPQSLILEGFLGIWIIEAN
jgi:hypothetical protein